MAAFGRHHTAGFRTIAAGLGAFLAVVHGMLGALLATGVADLSAEQTDALGERGTAGHFMRGK